jgi:hypothetical protein
MMAYSEDHIALAAEYALGTLDADERAQVETMMSVDKGFTAMVQAWEQKLGVLNQMVGSIEPRPEVWDKIRTAAGLSAPQEPLVLPQAAPPPPIAPEISQPAVAVDDSNVIQLSAAGAVAGGPSSEAANAGGRGQDSGRFGAGGAVCRRPAEGGWLAGVHSHG